MKSYPSIPRLADAPSALLAGGHLWLQEKVDGAQLRFQLQETGVIRFGDRDTVFDPDGIPDPYRHAVRHVRERLDREAVRDAVDDVESVVFFGEATHRQRIDYDWERTPSFLGFDVWSASNAAFLPPDAVERSYDRLGLDAINAFHREVRAQDFDADSYEIPDSNWYDGPPEGVVVRTKTGQRATFYHPRFEDCDDVAPPEASAEELARRYATDRRFERCVGALRSGGGQVTVETVFARVLEAVLREEHHRLFHANASVDMSAFRSAVAGRTRQFLDDWDSVDASGSR